MLDAEKVADFDVPGPGLRLRGKLIGSAQVGLVFEVNRNVHSLTRSFI